MSSLMPTFARSPWIAVAMLFGDCIPEPDSGTQKTALKPFGYPASASSCLALFGSYGYFVTSSVYAHLIEGGIGPLAVVPVPFKMSLEIEIGRASCRERVEVSVGRGAVEDKIRKE